MTTYDSQRLWMALCVAVGVASVLGRFLFLWSRKVIGLYGGAMDGAFVKQDAVDGQFLVAHIKKRKWMKVDTWDWCRSDVGADAKVTYKLSGEKLIHFDTELL